MASIQSIKASLIDNLTPKTVLVGTSASLGIPGRSVTVRISPPVDRLPGSVTAIATSNFPKGATVLLALLDGQWQASAVTNGLTPSQTIDRSVKRRLQPQVIFFSPFIGVSNGIVDLFSSKPFAGAAFAAPAGRAIAGRAVAYYRVVIDDLTAELFLVEGNQVTSLGSATFLDAGIKFGNNTFIYTPDQLFSPILGLESALLTPGGQLTAERRSPIGNSVYITTQDFAGVFAQGSPFEQPSPPTGLGVFNYTVFAFANSQSIQVTIRDGDSTSTRNTPPNSARPALDINNAESLSTVIGTLQRDYTTDLFLLSTDSVFSTPVLTLRHDGAGGVSGQGSLLSSYTQNILNWTARNASTGRYFLAQYNSEPLLDDFTLPLESGTLFYQHIEAGAFNPVSGRFTLSTPVANRDVYNLVFTSNRSGGTDSEERRRRTFTTGGSGLTLGGIRDLILSLPEGAFATYTNNIGQPIPASAWLYDSVLPSVGLATSGVGVSGVSTTNLTPNPPFPVINDTYNLNPNHYPLGQAVFVTVPLGDETYDLYTAAVSSIVGQADLDSQFIQPTYPPAPVPTLSFAELQLTSIVKVAEAIEWFPNIDPTQATLMSKSIVGVGASSLNSQLFQTIPNVSEDFFIYVAKQADPGDSVGYAIRFQAFLNGTLDYDPRELNEESNVIMAKLGANRATSGRVSTHYATSRIAVIPGN